MRRVRRMRIIVRDVRASVRSLAAAGDFAQALMRRYARLWRRWAGLSLIFRRVRPASQVFNLFHNDASPAAVRQWQIIRQMHQHVTYQMTVLNPSATYSRVSVQPSRVIVNRAFMQRIHFHTGEWPIRVPAKERIVYDGRAATEAFYRVPESEGSEAGAPDDHRYTLLSRQREGLQSYPAQWRQSLPGSLPADRPQRLVTLEQAKPPLVLRRAAPVSKVVEVANLPPSLERQAADTPRNRPQTADIPLDVNLLTEKVIQAIDRRVTAQRERMGRV